MESVRVTDEALLERATHHRRILPQITQQQPSSKYWNVKNEQKQASKHGYKDKLWAHLQHTSLLGAEIEQQYGLTASHVVLDNYAGKRTDGQKSQVIDTILTTRHQQYLDKLNANTSEFRYLLSQKEQLEKDNTELQQIKKLVTIERAPIATSLTDRAFSELPPEEGHKDIVPYDGRGSSQSVTSFIKQTNERLPAEIEKYRKLRENLEQRYAKLYRPYDGQLGPQSYESWQLADYHMVRSIVDETVEKFLDSYFRKVPSHCGTKTDHSLTWADGQQRETQRTAVLQATAIQLTMEEIVLQVTRKLTEEIAEEFFYLYRFLSNRSDVMFARTAQSVAKGEAHDDIKTESRILTMLRHLQHERLTQFSHSQPLDTKRSGNSGQ